MEQKKQKGKFYLYRPTARSRGYGDSSKEYNLDVSFVNINMEGAVTSLLVVDDPYASDDAEDEYLLLVGTTTGDVYISDILSKKSMGIIYICLPLEIPPRGKNPLTNKERTETEMLMDEEDMQIYKQYGISEMGSFSTTSLWIQFRGGMLGLYSWDLQGEQVFIAT
ncbi:hypothetical protein M3Y97_00137000 [Aphelenchoides bicaudatus]|nr:hypothetical protein M3Y97_00137000 [Aphelenchoides bicaudatus]